MRAYEAEHDVKNYACGGECYINRGYFFADTPQKLDNIQLILAFLQSILIFSQKFSYLSF